MSYLAKYLGASQRVLIYNVFMDIEFNKEHLLKFVQIRMPFGKYQGRLLIDLPDEYLVWFSNRGFPQGELGKLLEELAEIKLNGLEFLFKDLR